MRSAVIVIAFCLGLGCAAAASDEPASGVLHLTNSGFVNGQLQASDSPHVLRWRSPLFTQPLEFALNGVKAVHYTRPAMPSQPIGEFCVELTDDGVLFGNLLSLTEDGVELDAGRFGNMHVRREYIRRLFRWQGADLIYLGPNGLAGWKDPAATPQWRDDGGQPFTEGAGATLFGDFGIPAKAIIEFELSWKQKPDFLFALGVSEDPSSVLKAFRFAVWDSDLVAVGESERDADIAAVQTVDQQPGRLLVQAYLDQEQQRLLLFSHSGAQLANLKVTSKKPPIHAGLRLTNKKGDVRLDRLRISRWNGVPPRPVQVDKSRLHRTDGSIVYGRVIAFDPATKHFTVRDDKTETRVAADLIADVYLSPSSQAAESVTRPPDSTLRVVYHDGSQLNGHVTRIDDTHLSLSCLAIQEPLRLPRTDLRSLVVLKYEAAQAASQSDGHPGRLEIDGARLPGRLVNGREQTDASCLVWRPDLGTSASPLSLGVAGRIVYRDPPKPQPKPTAAEVRLQQRQQAQRPAGFGQAFANLLNGTTPVPTVTAGRRSLHLRSGDTIPCEVAAIHERGVTFKTPLSDATFVPHEKIKAVELVPTQQPPKLTKSKRERLLTLPRLLKDAPPTHLVCSSNGDFLRGRVLEMDDQRLKVEVRLETQEVPRNRVHQIIWLHADELRDETPPATAAVTGTATRVQTLRADGNRLTFVADRMDGATLSGTSDVLGACRADLTQVDQLLFGAAIEQSAAVLAYHRWKLHHAIEPKYVQAEDHDAPSDRSPGTESPLVGQPAPDFELELLGGGKFHLADRKGQIVVLDFWATWCGPCLQTMPLVDEVVREFAEARVELIAVNLEEQPPQIKSMLERHKLQMPVALDRDGVAAAKYTVTAIPQTVVIGRDGRVARLYVGGGSKLAEPLRNALRELVGGPVQP